MTLIDDDGTYQLIRYEAGEPTPDRELAVEAVNALPELLAIAEAACAIRDSGIVVGDSPYASAPVELMTALIAVVGAVRKAGS